MSRERRFFAGDLDAGKVVLDPEESHHLLRVLRLREGAEVVAFDGKGRSVRARFVGIASESAILQVVGDEPPRESPLPLVLAVAPPKGDRMSLAVQKLTELGVVRVVPLLTERGELDRERCRQSRERWRRVALEASKQCGRSLVPEIDEPREISEILATWSGRVLMADPGGGHLPAVLSSSAPLLVLVGPEGGWSERERSLAEAKEIARFGLGPRTLRTETAAIAAASVLQFLVGDANANEPGNV